jgi:hypothetical protein
MKKDRAPARLRGSSATPPCWCFLARLGGSIQANGLRLSAYSSASLGTSYLL